METKLSWHLATLKNGKPTLVDFSKVMYICDASKGGTAIHFQMAVENSTGKQATKTLTVREPVAAFLKVLKGRAFL
ncbi:hypothetical protein ASD31_15445 [Rhizobium sp. Root482]|nr:hypothetical protein ASD31_15445 [Rhizobium sp. Root482]